jgi:lysine-N-methylase
MTRFQCLGSDCESTCCQGWTILVDKAQHDLLKERMTSPEEQAELEAGIQRIEGQRHALMVLRDDGMCTFLDPKRMCSLQGRYGEPLLPVACAMYPRWIGRLGDIYELSGSISCPEVARQYLLVDDGLDPAPGTRAAFGRGAISRTIEAGTTDPYERSFPAMRALMVSLLRDRRYPVASRLGFVAALAAKTRDQLRRGVSDFDSAAVQKIGNGLMQDEVRDALDTDFRAFDPEGPFAVSVVRALILIPAPMAPKGLRDLFAEVGAWYAERAAPLDGDTAVLAAAYRGLPRPPAAAFELLVERFAVHQAMSNWYVKQDSLIGYVHELLARIALVSFLVTTRLAMQAEPLEGLFVRVVFNVARLFEHNAELVRRIIQGLEQHGMAMEHALALTRV